MIYARSPVDELDQKADRPGDADLREDTCHAGATATTSLTAEFAAARRGAGDIADRLARARAAWSIAHLPSRGADPATACAATAYATETGVGMVHCGIQPP